MSVREEALVVGIEESRPGISLLDVLLGDQVEKAINYDHFSGHLKIGDRVLLNTTAVKLGLGTGGYHFVVANLSRPTGGELGRGRIMKARYTPSQVQVEAVEEGPWHEALKGDGQLAGMVVAVASLHSMLPVICAGIKELAGMNCRVVYIMTDGASLPLAMSRLVCSLREKGLLDGVVTVGQAYGGDIEAVNVYSGLLAAQVVFKPRVVVVAMGPGMVGTGTFWGHTALEQGEVINAVSILGGRPVAAVRMSKTDRRERHLGISHHTLTALGRVALRPAVVALPLLGEDEKAILEQLHGAGLPGQHRLLWADGSPAVGRLKREGLYITTMGRGYEEDPVFFLAAGAAGTVAATMAEGINEAYI